MTRIKIADLCLQDANGEEEEFFQTTNDNGEIVVLTEEESQETTSTNEVEPLDTETNEEKEEKSDEEDSEFDGETDVDENESEEPVDDGNDSVDESTVDEGEDIERAGKEAKETEDEAELAVQAFEVILKRMHAQGGVCRKDRLELLQIESGLSLQDARYYSSFPSSLCLQDTRGSVIAKMAKAVLHATGKTLQYALAGSLWAMGMKPENREKFLKMDPWKAIATFPVQIPKAVIDLKDRVTGKDKIRAAVKKNVAVIQQTQFKKVDKIVKDMSQSARRILEKAGRELQVSKGAPEKEAILERTKVELERIGEPISNTFDISKKIQSIEVFNGVSCKGIVLNNHQKAAIIADWYNGKNSLTNKTDDSVKKQILSEAFSNVGKAIPWPESVSEPYDFLMSLKKHIPTLIDYSVKQSLYIGKCLVLAKEVIAGNGKDREAFTNMTRLTNEHNRVKLPDDIILGLSQARNILTPGKVSPEDDGGKYSHTVVEDILFNNNVRKENDASGKFKITINISRWDEATTFGSSAQQELIAKFEKVMKTLGDQMVEIADACKSLEKLTDPDYINTGGGTIRIKQLSNVGNHSFSNVERIISSVNMGFMHMNQMLSIQESLVNHIWKNKTFQEALK